MNSYAHEFFGASVARVPAAVGLYGVLRSRQHAYFVAGLA